MKLKLLGLMMYVGMTSVSYANAAEPKGDTLACVVNNVVPEGANFFWVGNIGPAVGDTMTFVTGKNTIDSFVLDTRENGLTPTVPLGRAGAKLELNKVFELGYTYEGRHEGRMLGGLYFGFLSILYNTDLTEANIDFRVVEIGYDHAVMHKVNLKCVPTADEES